MFQFRVPKNLASRFSSLRGNRGFTVLEVMVGAAIIAVTIPFALSNFSTNIRQLDGTRVAASIDQLDEYIAGAVAAQMHTFLRRMAANNTCSNTAALAADSAHGLAADSVPGYFNNLLQNRVSTSSIGFHQLLSISGGGFGTVGPSTLGPYFNVDPVNGFKQNSTGAGKRFQALSRCYRLIKNGSGVQSFQTVAPGKNTDFGNSVGLYFCGQMGEQVSANASLSRTSLQNMAVFGEFLFIERDPAGAPLAAPPVGADPSNPTPSDVETCKAMRKNFNRPGGVPPSPRLGVLYYTLYWAASEEGSQNAIFRDYSGSILVSDNATTAY